MICGGPSVGKTSVAVRLARLVARDGRAVAACKIDCLHSDDLTAFRALGVPCALGLSGDICPDHYLVSNLEEIIDWAGQKGADTLMIETAGLCNRCSPATKNSIALCVVDCSCGIAAPKKLGPMLTQADIVAMTKIDAVSQAEREIFTRNIQLLNPAAAVIAVDASSGYGIEQVYARIAAYPDFDNFGEDSLRHSMPGGVCSYCVGERRIGKGYQQGIVEKIAL
jgi:Ni2+-binding GTPase involved in maturation of urease and hydrogenase